MNLFNLFCKFSIIIIFGLINGEIFDMKDDKVWKDKLSDEEYFVTRCSGTEPPFTGKYYKYKEKGTYNCNCCNSLYLVLM